MYENIRPLFHEGYRYLDVVIAKYKPQIYFDVGANEGGFFITWLTSGATTIHGFEPVPDMAEKAREKYRDDPRVHVHQVAVSDVKGRLENVNVYNTWSIAPFNSRRDVARDYRAKAPFSVDVITLDEVGVIPDFVKLDVDGYEYNVLKGMKNILLTRKPPIYFEFSFLPTQLLGVNAMEMCQFIYQVGYQAVSLDGWICPDPATMMRNYPHNTSYDIMLMPVSLLP